MFHFTLNQREAAAETDKSLIEYLREDARLTSVKNGCGDGVCGSCSVIVNGKAARACTLTVARVHGKSVTTVEGLSPREREVYAWAFGEVGAVQCGFCMPGMVMSAKALLDANPAPTAAEVKSAIRYNLCRCTGYAKVERAIQLAAGALANAGVHDVEAAGARVGERTVRAEAKEKLLGTGEFVDDMQVEGMLHGAVLRAKFPRALVKRIDAAAARALPGVEIVLTARDVPGERMLGHVVYDWPVMIAEGEETRYVGDALALVAATTKEAARKAIELDSRGIRGARAAALAEGGDGGGSAATACERKRTGDDGVEAGRCGARDCRGQACGDATLFDAAAGACVSGAGECAGCARSGRIADGVYRGTKRVRRSSRDCADAGRGR